MPCDVAGPDCGLHPILQRVRHRSRHSTKALQHHRVAVPKPRPLGSERNALRCWSRVFLWFHDCRIPSVAIRALLDLLHKTHEYSDSTSSLPRGARMKDARGCYIEGLALVLYAVRKHAPQYAILSVTSTSGYKCRTVYARVPSGLDLAALAPAPAGLALGAGLPLAPGLGIGLASASPGPPSSRRAPSRGTSVYSGGRSTTSTRPASSCLLNWVRRGESSPV
jgi:hypothetical protein